MFSGISGKKFLFLLTLYNQIANLTVCTQKMSGMTTFINKTIKMKKRYNYNKKQIINIKWQIE